MTSRERAADCVKTMGSVCGLGVPEADVIAGALADAVRAFRMAPPPDLRPIYDERGNLVKLLLAGEVVE